MSSSSSSSRRIHDLQQVFVRQSVILHDNLADWDQRLQHGEDWPSMLGRLNAAVNQTTNVDQGIEDALDHFAVEPKKCLPNPSDVPVFLSVRIVDDNLTDGHVESNSDGGERGSNSGNNKNNYDSRKPAEHILYQYERDAAVFAREFEESMSQNRF